MKSLRSLTLRSNSYPVLMTTVLVMIVLVFILSLRFGATPSHSARL